MSQVVRRLALFACLFAVLAAPGSAHAAVSLQSIGTFARPIDITSPPGDTARLLIVERGGTVRLIKNGVPQSTPFLDMSSLVESGIGEGGLLSIALAPDYASTGRLYAYYTPSGTGATTSCANSATDSDVCPPIRVAEFRSSGGSADTVSASTRRQVIEVPHPKYSNHYGGQLQFDAAGRLYMGLGDGGSGGDPDGNAQNGASLLGKILRIDPRQSGARPYTVPADNPFIGAPGVRPELWAYGLRNPFRFSLDRQTGDLLIGDVGQASTEEVDLHPRAQGSGRGRNFGWNVCEGNQSYPAGTACPLAGGNYVGPIYQYAHTGGACSVTGGYVSRNPTLQDLLGKYVFSDYCTGQTQSIDVPSGSGNAQIVDQPNANVDSFGEDACGRLYVSELTTGTVSRFTDDDGTTCATALPLPPAPPSNLPPVAPPHVSGGGSGTGGGTSGVTDLRPPLLGLRTGSRQHPLRNHGVIVRVRCDEACSYRVGGRLSLRRHGRKISLRQRTGSLPANTTARLRLRLSGPSARTLRLALRRRKRVKVRVGVRVRDHSANLATGNRLFRLVR